MTRRFDVPRPRLALALLLVAVVVTALFALSTSSAAFSVYNGRWDGGSSLSQLATETGAEVRVIDDASAYERVAPDGTVAMLLSPSTTYEGEDGDSLRAFVRQGGTLVVADDFGGGGNDVMETVGARARFDGRLLRDERTYYRSPNLPIAPNATATPVTAPATLTLNRGTALRPNGATVAVTTTPFAYLDEGEPERFNGEPLAAYPVATVEQVGEGYVVAVSDPSLFINAMLDRDGNRAFARSLFDAHDSVILDYSHAERPPPLTAFLKLVRGSPAIQTALGVLGLGAVLVWARLPAFRRGDPDEAGEP